MPPLQEPASARGAREAQEVLLAQSATKTITGTCVGTITITTTTIGYLGLFPTIPIPIVQDLLLFLHHLIIDLFLSILTTMCFKE
jgi:hypothetical protein